VAGIVEGPMHFLLLNQQHQSTELYAHIFTNHILYAHILFTNHSNMLLDTFKRRL